MIIPNALLAAWLLITPLAAQPAAAPTVEDLLDAKTIQALAEFDRTLDGVIGVAAIDLTTGRVLGYNAATTFTQASVIKVPILIRLHEAAASGAVDLERQITLTAADRVAGSGEIQRRLESGPVTLSIGELALAMIRDSDNTATNAIIALLGMEPVNAMLDRLGFVNTRLRRIMMDTPAAMAGRENVSTPIEMARLMELIHHGRAVSPQASRSMAALFALTNAAIRAAVPAGIRVAAKPGSVPGVHAEAGIVSLPNRPFVLAVMSAALPDGAPNPIGAVTAIVLKHYQRLAAINAFGHRVR